MLIEPDGFHGSVIQVLRALSLGTEAMPVQRHDYGFGYAINGRLVTGFEPTWPAQRWDSGSDRLLGKMRTAGLDGPQTPAMRTIS